MRLSWTLVSDRVESYRRLLDFTQPREEAKKTYWHRLFQIDAKLSLLSGSHALELDPRFRSRRTIQTSLGLYTTERGGKENLLASPFPNRRETFAPVRKSSA